MTDASDAVYGVEEYDGLEGTDELRQRLNECPSYYRLLSHRYRLAFSYDQEIHRCEAVEWSDDHAGTNITTIKHEDHGRVKLHLQLTPDSSLPRDLYESEVGIDVTLYGESVDTVYFNVGEACRLVGMEAYSDY